MHFPDYQIIIKFSELYNLNDNEIMILNSMTNNLIHLEQLSNNLKMPLIQVKKHINNMLKKTKVNNRAELMALIVNYLLLKEVKQI